MAVLERLRIDIDISIWKFRARKKNAVETKASTEKVEEGEERERIDAV